MILREGGIGLKVYFGYIYLVVMILVGRRWGWFGGRNLWVDIVFFRKVLLYKVKYIFGVYCNGYYLGYF